MQMYLRKPFILLCRSIETRYVLDLSLLHSVHFGIKRSHAKFFISVRRGKEKVKCNDYNEIRLIKTQAISG